MTARPGLTACALCSGETLGDADTLPGGQRERLECLGRAGVARLTFVDCLDECERGDVVVARPARPGREAGAAPVWFERLAGDEATEVLERWLVAGGPGVAPLPDGLQAHVLARGPGDEEPADGLASSVEPSALHGAAHDPSLDG
ncbi:hypothetical protein CSO01_32850 [Cellulomonas soli]|uniref:(2Fe-2S) ferredoxin domain-containing protein n=2 Tax=Cellulomonas soli TaxID=931535 RepID=A0A512PHB1_9CELL|nr:hypothetical protein CSO01_32850 [Cellulomonas soli]